MNQARPLLSSFPLLRGRFAAMCSSGSTSGCSGRGSRAVKRERDDAHEECVDPAAREEHAGQQQHQHDLEPEQTNSNSETSGYGSSKLDPECDEHLRVNVEPPQSSTPLASSSATNQILSRCLCLYSRFLATISVVELAFIHFNIGITHNICGRAVCASAAAW